MIIRIEQVIEKVKLSRTTIWRMENCNQFPKRIRIGTKAMGWLEQDVDAWLAARPRGMYNEI
jgi:prophage regulatory protein